MSHTTPYTDAAVELVAEALCLDDWPDTTSGWRRVMSDEYRQNARAALAALAAAGWRQVPPHLLPLLKLTPDEVAAIAVNLAGWLELGDDPLLRSALNKLTATDTVTEPDDA